MNIIHYNSNLKKLAAELRTHSTQSEVLLWEELKGKHLEGYRFIRQEPMGEYIVDFYCKEVGLVIELDGLSHQSEETMDKDGKKEEYLKSIGLRVLRFEDEDVVKDRENVLRVIVDALHTPPTPSQEGMKLLLLIPFLFLFSILTACHYPAPVTAGKDMPQKTRDSVNYLMERHYTLNSNFEVTSDSLMLQQLPLMDVLPVFKGEKLVVAEFMVQPEDSVDSVWVKVARDQETMGWVHEKELLKKVVPVDSVSQFIHFFSNSHTVAFFIILALFSIGYIYRAIRRQKLQLIWLNDIDSIFPTILLWLVATAATLYASIQYFVPGTWEQFYYNPSLNPLSLPFILSLFMFNVWGIIIIGLATLDDLFHQTRTEAAFFYLLGLMSCSIFIYLFFTFTTYYYIGYPCLLIYTVWSFNRIRHTARYKFSCGNCGAKMKAKGICTHCGAINE